MQKKNIQIKKTKTKLNLIVTQLGVIFMAIILSKCSVKRERDNLSDYYKGISSQYSNLSADTLNFKLFKKVPFLHNSNGIPFTRVGNEMILFNDSRFQLFYYLDNHLSFAGYWGERNDSILFIPHDRKDCPVEFLVVHWGYNGFFKLDDQDSCFKELSSVVNDSYFYKILSQDSISIQMNHYISPDERTNVTENEHLEWVIPLFLSLDRIHGIVDLEYKFDLTEQRVVPWIDTAVEN